MKENNTITFEELPVAVFHLLQDVAEIKNHLLNNSASFKPEPVQSPKQGILTVNDVSAKLGITKGGVYNLTHLRQIPYFKRGGRIYFDAEEIDQWIRMDRRKTIKQLQDETNLSNKKK